MREKGGYSLEQYDRNLLKVWRWRVFDILSHYSACQKGIALREFKKKRLNIILCKLQLFML